MMSGRVSAAALLICREPSRPSWDPEPLPEKHDLPVKGSRAKRVAIDRRDAYWIRRATQSHLLGMASRTRAAAARVDRGDAHPSSIDALKQERLALEKLHHLLGQYVVDGSICDPTYAIDNEVDE